MWIPIEPSPAEAAIAAAQAADDAWTAGYTAVAPQRTWPGDFRYTEAAKGAPGSPLRALYDDFRDKVEAMNQALRA